MIFICGLSSESDWQLSCRFCMLTVTLCCIHLQYSMLTRHTDGIGKVYNVVWIQFCISRYGDLIGCNTWPSTIPHRKLVASTTLLFNRLCHPTTTKLIATQILFLHTDNISAATIQPVLSPPVSEKENPIHSPRSPPNNNQKTKDRQQFFYFFQRKQNKHRRWVLLRRLRVRQWQRR